MHLSRRPLLVLLPSLLVVGTGAFAGAEQPAPPVRVTVAMAPEQPSTGNYVTVAVSLTDVRTGLAPTEPFVVFGQASNAFDEQTEPGPCTSRSLQVPDAPAGVFDCTIIVDHGGKWLFEGLANRVSRQGQPVEVARGGVVLDIRAGTLLSAGKPPPREIVAKRGDVLALMLHLTMTMGWLLAVLALMMLSVGRGRTALSGPALHWLEVRRNQLVMWLWTTTGLTIATGVVLMSRQTAYATPRSVTAAKAIMGLPYGRAYFVSLAVKLGVFAVMVIAAWVLARQSQRLARVADRTGRPVPRPVGAGMVASPWSPPPGSEPGQGADLLEGAAPGSSPRPALPARSVGTTVAAGVVLLGLVAIEICVVLLKYFHELIEATRTAGAG